MKKNSPESNGISAFSSENASDLDLKALKKALPLSPGIQGRDKYGNFVVLIPLVMKDGKAHLLFEKRASNIRQGDEICFPGGRFDPDLDSDFLATALRETHEELSLLPEQAEILGPLDTMVAPMGVILESFVAILDSGALENLSPNPQEVAKCLLIPLDYFLQNSPEIYSARIMVHPDGLADNEILFPAEELGVPERYRQPWGGNLIRLYAFRYQEEVIWGITAELVMELVRRVQGFQKSGISLEEAVIKHVRAMQSDSKGSHDWDHTLRVKHICDHIGKIEGADMEILTLAAYLHDIGRHQESLSRGQICHAQAGAAMARDILLDLGAESDLIEKVVHCVESHRFRGSNRPVSLEARILFDADKLDSIGAVGIGRAFLFAGEVGARLHNPVPDTSKAAEYSREDTAYREFVVKLSSLKDRMTTDEGRRIALKRHQFMADFFDRLNLEVEGEC